MSKSDKRKFCQPIPLSAILDPTYRSPFSKLQQFQVDMDISASKMYHHQQQQPRPSVWRKLQSTLISAMSNLVVIAHPVASFSAPMLSRSTSSLVPWKSFRACDLVLPENEPEFCKSTTEKALPEASSLYYSIRSGLECLRYFATHPLGYEESIRKQQKSHPFHHDHHHSHPHQEHHCRRSLSMPSSPQKSRSLDTPVLSPTSEAEIEIIIHSVSTSQDQFCSKLQCSSPTPPTAEHPKGMSGEAGCIRIETNWRTKNGMSSCQEEVSVANFHAVSVCSPSSPTRGGGTLTFSCSSTLSSPPKAMAKPCDPRRRKTESESSTDSFIEFSASVESTDSFCIVFEPVGGCIDEEVLNREEEDDDNEDWQDEDSDEDDSDEEEDQVFNYSNTSDDIFMDAFDCGADQVDFTLQPELLKKKKTKRVSFNEENLERVIEFEDDTESRNSRETYWEMLARDRARFQDRIFRTGDILDSILEPAHRSKVFQQRYCAEN